MVESYESWRPFHDKQLDDDNEKYIKFGIARRICAIAAIVFGPMFILAILCSEDLGDMWVVPLVLFLLSASGIGICFLFRWIIGQRMGERLKMLERRAQKVKKKKNYK